MKRCLGVFVAGAPLALAAGTAHAQSSPTTCGMLGGGNDFLYNNDGLAETVNCGGGNADDAEVDTGAVDTFIGCEL
jgi:hypothetical protein